MTLLSREDYSAPGVVLHASPATPDLFRLALRRFASGAALVSTTHLGQRHGLVATSVTGVSAEPPTLLICVNQSASAHDPIKASGAFCISLLGAENQDVAAHFSASHRRAERFVGEGWIDTPVGAPALATSLAWLACTVEKTVQHHTHTVFFGRIEHIATGTAGLPLVYFDQRFLKTT